MTNYKKRLRERLAEMVEDHLDGFYGFPSADDISEIKDDLTDMAAEFLYRNGYDGSVSVHSEDGVYWEILIKKPTPRVLVKEV